MFGGPADKFFTALDELLRSLILRERPSEGREKLAFYHDRFREMVLERTPAYRLQSIHLQAAAAYQRGGGEEHDVLARHFLEGGDSDNARKHLRFAAESARQAQAARKALGYYEQLQQLGDNSVETQEAMADLCCMLGENQRALDLCDRLLACETDFASASGAPPSPGHGPAQPGSPWGDARFPGEIGR